MQSALTDFRSGTVRLDFDTIRSLSDVRESPLFQQQVRDANRVLESQNIDGVYFTIPSIDGRSLSRLVTTPEFERVAHTGIRMHHHALTDARTDMAGNLIGFSAAEGEGIGIPDLTTLRPVPWEPRLAQVICFFYEEATGQVFDHDVRANLMRLDSRLRMETGARMLAGVEPEVTLLRDGRAGRTEPATRSFAFYNLASFAELEPVITGILDDARELGLDISHIDAEDSGQLEVNQRPQSPLDCADSLLWFRQAISFQARRHGLRASFMPKLSRGSSGSGLHHHFSLVDPHGGELLIGDRHGDCRLSDLGAAIIGGVLAHADALTLIGCPWVNSYKRFWDPGHWAPFVKGYGYNNRTVAVRIPRPGQLEVRHFDSAANPYLTLAGLIVASLHGINTRMDPGSPTTTDELRDPGGAGSGRHVPLTLEAAITAFEADDRMHEVMRPLLHRVFVAMRRDDLARYWAEVSPWELDFYLDRLP